MRTIESYARLEFDGRTELDSHRRDAYATGSSGSGDLHGRDAYATGHTTPAQLWTDLLLTPGAELLWTDGLLTNFHLPRSTLMALVATLLGADPERAAGRLRSLYQEAVERRYRFYSYGDAMLILP